MRLPRNLEGVGFNAGTCSCGFSFLMCILSASMKKEVNEEKQWRKNAHSHVFALLLCQRV